MNFKFGSTNPAKPLVQGTTTPSPVIKVDRTTEVTPETSVQPQAAERVELIHRLVLVACCGGGAANCRGTHLGCINCGDCMGSDEAKKVLPALKKLRPHVRVFYEPPSPNDRTEFLVEYPKDISLKDAFSGLDVVVLLNTFSGPVSHRLSRTRRYEEHRGEP